MRAAFQFNFRLAGGPEKSHYTTSRAFRKAMEVSEELKETTDSRITRKFAKYRVDIHLSITKKLTAMLTFNNYFNKKFIPQKSL